MSPGPMTVPVLPSPDLPLLRKTLDWARSEHEKFLRGEPSEWDQRAWWNETSCGTVCCFAGRVAAETDGIGVRQVMDVVKYVRAATGEYIPDCAQRHLGITDTEGDDLFRASNTIDDLERVGREIAARVGEEL